VLLAELAFALGGWNFAPGAASLRFAPVAADVQNTVQIGRLLYTDYVLLFQASGLVLLVAMIGAIVLTLRDRRGSRKQDIGRQVARMSADTLVMVDAVRGAGVAPGDILRPKPVEAEPVADHGAAGGHH
jgi:NADH-quinone oxidoreductase subunit J